MPKNVGNSKLGRTLTHKNLLESYEEHRAIVAAIKKRDLKAAVAALEKNIQ